MTFEGKRGKLIGISILISFIIGYTLATTGAFTQNSLLLAIGFVVAIPFLAYSVFFIYVSLRFG